MQVREPNRLQHARHSPVTRTLPKPVSPPLPSFTSACHWAHSRPGDGHLDNPLQTSRPHSKDLVILGRMTVQCGASFAGHVHSRALSAAPRSGLHLWATWPQRRPQRGRSWPLPDEGDLCGPSESLRPFPSEVPYMLGLSGNRRLYANVRYLLSLIWDKFLRHLLVLYLLFSELLRVGLDNDLLSRRVSSPSWFLSSQCKDTKQPCCPPF